MINLKNNHSVIVGIFILLGISIFVVTIFTLGGQKKTFVKTFPLHAVFDNVSGLLKGGNIWFSGVKVGTVKSITIYGHSDVKVDMSVEVKVQEHIPADAKARIGSDGLIGNKIIIIYGGNFNLPHVKDDDNLAVEKALSTDDMLATLQLNNTNLLQITKDFKSISRKIDSGPGLLSTLLNDAALTGKLQYTMNDLQATVSNFKTVSANSKNVLNSLQAFSAKLNTKGNSLNDLASDTFMYKNVKGSLMQLNDASHNVKSFTVSLKQASDRLDQKDNLAGVLLNDPSSAASFKAILKNLEAGSHKLDQDLEALQHNFLLKGFFKKKEKETPAQQ
jgi:phospholipid/cholesterol/gamma-HCH transport system substrate-binding protein